MSRNSIINEITDDDFRDMIARSYSYSDCLRELGLSTGGGCSRTVLNERVKKLNCDTSHFIRNGSKKDNSQTRFNMSEILVKNSTYKSRTKLKERLIRDGYIDNKCGICGISTWLGKPLSLELHHKDGVNNNNEISNLQLLCPNCHSQTDTYAGKNIGKH